MRHTTRLFRNSTLVSMDPDIGVVRNCDVRIDGPIIVEVGQNLPVRGDEIIDCTDRILFPGFVDTHRHMWQTQLRTVTGDYTLRDYGVKIRNYYGSCYTPDDVYLADYVGALESVAAGTTCLLDHAHIMNSPAHADAAVAGLKDAGIRATFCYGLYANPSYPRNADLPAPEDDAAAVDTNGDLDRTDPSWRVADAKRVRDQYFADNSENQLVRFGLAPYEMERMSTEQLVKEIALGRELGAAIVTGHVAMGTYDRGGRVVEKLSERNVLGPDLLFSHGATLTPGELASLKKSAGSISSCPSTEIQMGMGFPIAFSAVHDHACIAGLGSDIAANNSADMFGQMRLVLQCQRWIDAGNSPPAQPSLLRTCAQVLRMATQGGAEALGLGPVIGSITPGKRADIVLVRHDSLHMTPMTDPEIALVLYAVASDVDDVYIDGVPRKSNGAISGYSRGIKDWPALRRRLEDSTKAIFARAASIDPSAHEKNVQEYFVRGVPSDSSGAKE